jgi:hypothetical protein
MLVQVLKDLQTVTFPGPCNLKYLLNKKASKKPTFNKSHSFRTKQTNIWAQESENNRKMEYMI